MLPVSIDVNIREKKVKHTSLSIPTQYFGPMFHLPYDSLALITLLLFINLFLLC